MTDLSHQEKTLWGALVAVLVIGGGYFARTVNMITFDAIDPGECAGLSIGAVLLLIFVQIAYQIVLTLHSRRDPPDERDRLIAALAGRNAYHVLMVGAWLAIGHIVAGGLFRDVTHNAWLTQFATGQLVALAAVSAELAKYGSQLAYYRWGH